MRRYIHFISVIKEGVVRPKYVPEETWESWMTIWKDPKIIGKSKINSRNRRGGENVVAQGTHTGGSITIGEHRKRLEKYQEVLQHQTQSQSDVDHLAFYQAAGGEKRRRIYGLGSQEKLFDGPNFCASSRFDVSTPIPSLNEQIAPIDMDQFLKQLIPSLTDHLLSVLAERVRGLITSPSSQLDNPIENLSSMAPLVPTPTLATADNVEVNVSIYEDDRGSPVSH